jgi:peptide/nickel transport system substrate-binding protein
MKKTIMRNSVIYTMTLVGAVLVLLLAACGKKSTVQENAAEETAATFAVADSWETFNIFNTTSDYDKVVHVQIYDKLVFNHYNGQYSPRLAKSWEFAPDGSGVIYTIDERARWHDGEKVTAKDVEFTAKLHSNPLVVSKGRTNLRYFAGTDNSGAEISSGSIGVKALDDYRVQFTFKTPIAQDVILSQFNRGFLVLPEHIFGKFSIEQINTEETWIKNAVGSGPYKFQSQMQGERIDFIANENYHLKKPSINRLVFRLVSTPSLLAGFISGEIDFSFGALPPDDFAEARNYDNIVAESYKTYRYVYLGFDTRREWLSNPVIRQAFSLAIDRDKIVSIGLRGYGESLITPLSRTSRYFNQALLPIRFDPEDAKRILQAQGFDFNRALSLITISQYQTTGELVQQDLRAIGLDVNLQIVDTPTLLNDARAGKADLNIVGSAGGFDPSESAGLITPGSGSNFTGWTDTTLLDTSNRGLAEVDTTKRKTIYDEYQKLLTEQVPMAYLHSMDLLIAHSKRLKNIDVAATTEINWDTWNWEIGE